MDVCNKKMFFFIADMLMGGMGMVWMGNSMGRIPLIPTLSWWRSSILATLCAVKDVFFS